MLKKIKKFIQNLLRKKSDHIKKASTYEKDILFGQLQLLKATNIKVGVKIVGFHGIGHIKELKNHPWVVIKYLSKRINPF